MRIIDQDLWDRVKARQAAVALGKQEKPAEGFWDRRRPRYLLSGLIKCGECGGGFVKISKDHFGCAAARNKGTCTNTRTIRGDVLEETVLGGLQHRLMDDELLTLFCDEYTKQINALHMAESAGRAKDEARVKQIDREQDRIIDAIADGTLTGAKIKGRMHKLEAEADDIRARLADSPKEEKTLLHPKMGARYRQAVTNLRQALDRKDGRPEAVEILRSLIDRIVLNPDKAATKGYLIDIEGELAGILSLCAANKNAANVSESGIQQ